MKLPHLPPVVTTCWLHKQLQHLADNLVILEASLLPNEAGQDLYTSAHIPGARFLDLHLHVTPQPLVPRPPPDAALFEGHMRHLGINRETHVVVYDRGDVKILPAARAWWTIKYFGHQSVSMLDGGFMKWQYDGFDVEPRESNAKKLGDFTSRVQSQLLASYEDVQELVQSDQSQILDVRERRDFMGEIQEPSKFTEMAYFGTGHAASPDMKRGHIPGSVNIPYPSVYREDVKRKNKYLQLRNTRELKEEFDNVGITSEKPLTVMCYSGYTACIWTLVAEMLGHRDTAMYCGSWTEWGQRADDNSVTIETEKNDKSKL